MTVLSDTPSASREKPRREPRDSRMKLQTERAMTITTIQSPLATIKERVRNRRAVLARRRRGVTLVEVLIVVAIMAVIAGSMLIYFGRKGWLRP